MRVVFVALLTGLVLCQATPTAVAQQPTQAQANAIRQACRGDYQAHCASVPTGGSAALQCLRDNLPSLSPSCQSAVGATESGTAAPPAGAAPSAQAMPPMTPRQQAMMMRRACGGDFRRYCQGVSLGGGRALACLADHRESLSPPCQEALASARGR